MAFGKVDVNAKSAYAQSFGHLQDKTRFYDPWLKSDMRPELKKLVEKGIQAKAQGATSATGGGAGTAGIGMVPVYVDPRIVDTTRKYTPLVEMVPRVTNQGLTADFNKITDKGDANWLAEDAAVTDDDDTEDRASTSIKYLYAVGRVTGQAQASYPSYIVEGFQATGAGLSGTSFAPQAAPNAKQYQVIKRARALREEEERTIVNGSTSTDDNEFDGIVQLQSTVNQLDRSSSALKYDNVETAVRYAFDDSGRPNLGVASSSVLADLRKIMIDSYQYRPTDMTVELPFGVSSHLVLDTMVGPVPVIPSQNLSNTSGSKQIFFLDMDFMEMRVLQDLTYEDLAKTNDSQKFMLKVYETLIMKNNKFNAFIDNIS